MVIFNDETLFELRAEPKIRLLEKTFPVIPSVIMYYEKVTLWMDGIYFSSSPLSPSPVPGVFPSLPCYDFSCKLAYYAAQRQV